jgi:CHAT domain-containing protein
MQDEQGRAQRVLDDELVSLLARQGVQPQLVLLAACQSATRSMADAFLGLGPKLVRAGVPAVVAMQDVVTVETARKFSATFYRQLLAHDQVDLAVNEARSTLLTAGRADAAVPVLFMRLRDGLLFAPSDASDSDTGQPRIHIGQINVQNVEDSTVSITTTTGK